MASLAKVGEDFLHRMGPVLAGDGSLDTGIAGDLEATIIAPDGSTSTATVSEVGATAVYQITIGNALSTAEGAGNYFVRWRRTTVGELDGKGFEIQFYARDIDDLAQPGDAMDLVTDAVDAAAVATSGANEVRDAILADSTPFNGADIAAILVDTGTDIPARFTGIEGAGFATGTDSLEAIRNQGDAAWVTATGFAVPGDAMTLTAAALTAIDTELTGNHGAGSWIGVALTAAQATQLEELWQIHGLDSSNPLEVDATTPTGSRQVPASGAIIDQTVAVSGSVTTVTRV